MFNVECDMYDVWMRFILFDLIHQHYQIGTIPILALYYYASQLCFNFKWNFYDFAFFMIFFWTENSSFWSFESQYFSRIKEWLMVGS